MITSRILRHALAVFAAAVIATAFTLKPASAIGTDTPPPPKSDGGKKADKKVDKKTDKQKTEKKKKHDKSGALDPQDKISDAKFLAGYRAARALILDGDYEDGIAAMHALGHDDHPDVANYIGYAYRRLGDFPQSKTWYEKALAADPNHVRTWSYYGMWQMEQGHRDKAVEDLKKVRLLCGNTTCKAYVELKAVIDGVASY
jgi:tetratricopeptide (TPR) repeat protein